MRALRGALRCQRAEHVLGRVMRQTEVVDPLGVVLGDPELDGGHRRDGTGETDEGRRVGDAGNHARDVGHEVAHDRDGVRELLRCGWIGVQELLGHAHAPHVERHQTHGRVDTEHELGGTTADVDDEIWRRCVEVSSRAEERERSLLLTREQLRGLTQRIVRGGEELLAVRSRRVPRSSRSHALG